MLILIGNQKDNASKNIIHHFFKPFYLLRCHPNAVPEADCLNVAGVDDAVDRAVGHGEIGGHLVHPVVTLKGMGRR